MHYREGIRYQAHLPCRDQRSDPRFAQISEEESDPKPTFLWQRGLILVCQALQRKSLISGPLVIGLPVG